MFVTDQKTVLDADTASKALAEGYQRITGKKPSEAILRLLVGQTALETANWKSMHNYNFGNVRGTAPDGKWTSFRASEIIDGKEVFLPIGESNKFRAYSSAADGATDYVKVLKSRPHWWNGLQSKTVSGFIAGLTTPPVYFTASPALYAKVLDQRIGQYAQYAKKYAAAGVGMLGVIAAIAGGFYAAKKLRKP